MTLLKPKERLTVLKLQTPIQVGQSLSNVASEEAVIGSVLHKPELYDDLADIVAPQDFSNIIHGFIWYACDTLISQGLPIGILPIADEIEKQANPPLKGDDLLDKLATLTGKAQDIELAVLYAEKVREMALRLRVYSATDTIRATVLDKAQSLEEVKDVCDQALQVALESTPETDISFKQAVTDYYDRLVQGDVMRYLPTTIHAIDRVFPGIPYGKVAYLAGSAGMGKTTLMLAWTRRIAEKLAPEQLAIIFSLEMTKDEIIQILLSQLTGIPQIRLVGGWQNFDAIDKQAVFNAVARLERMPLEIIDTFHGGMTPPQMRRALRRQFRKGSVQFVAVDGLWLMHMAAQERNGERHEEINDLTVELKKMAFDFDVPMLVMHQYSRDIMKGRKREPKLSDLGGSVGIERNGHVVMGLYRDSYYDPDSDDNITEVHFMKARNMPTVQGRTATLRFIENSSDFESAGL